jgi:hypothetical protein
MSLDLLVKSAAFKYEGPAFGGAIFCMFTVYVYGYPPVKDWLYAILVVTNRALDGTGFVVVIGPRDGSDETVALRIFVQGEGETPKVI